MVAPSIAAVVGADITAQAAPSQEDTEADPDILAKIEAVYYKHASSWAAGLQDFAKRLFKYFLMLDIIIFAFAGGMGIAYGGKTLGQVLAELMLNVIMPAAFMFCVITYYPQWSLEILKGLHHIAGQIQPTGDIGSVSFFSAGLAIFASILLTVLVST